MQLYKDFNNVNLTAILCLINKQLMTIAKRNLSIKKFGSNSAQIDAAKQSIFDTKTVLTGLNFGALGALFNTFLIVPFYGSFCLYFGQVFVLICLLTRGLNAALIAVIISASAVAISQNNPFLFVIMLSEMFVIHMLLKKGYFVLQASFLFWLLIGTPLTLAFIAATSQFNSDILVISGLTQAINGLVCACLSALIYTFVPINSKYRVYKSAPPKFARIIFSLCMLTVTLPTLIVALVFTWKSTNQKEIEISSSLLVQAEQLSLATEDLIQKQKTTLEMGALSLSHTNDLDLAQMLLNHTWQKHSIFTSMAVTSTNGKVLVSAPIKYSRMLQQGQYVTLEQQNYFQESKKTLQAVVSEALVGRHFEQTPMIAVVAPIIKNGEFAGAIQGAIQLDDSKVLNSLNILQKNKQYYVVLDQNKKVVLASKELDIKELSNFDYKTSSNLIVESIPSLSHRGNSYIYQSVTTKNGWEVFVLTEPEAVTFVITDNFYILGFSILTILMIFSLIITSLAKRVTRPLVQLSQFFANPNSTTFDIKDDNVSYEIVKVTEQLSRSKKIMIDFQHQLENQVEEKTHQLRHLNEQLFTLSQKDCLTGLLNRSGFDELANASFRNCIRNHLKISMVLVDIDFFKNINDTYGHPAGDECIKCVAQVLSQFCKRETDVVGRYGGEEFIIMLVGGRVEEHHELLKLILTNIENMSIKVDDATINLTVSMGVSSLKKNYTMSFKEIIKSADEQLYKSKRSGRNKISIYLQ